ncbi:hypothetical protein PMI31_01387 [Pseudomonas sp. GM55]|nr:hypothetical protein PMI31_01387 [Pseudomonas sp. GM55]
MSIAFNPPVLTAAPTTLPIRKMLIMPSVFFPHLLKRGSFSFSLNPVAQFIFALDIQKP